METEDVEADTQYVQNLSHTKVQSLSQSLAVSLLPTSEPSNHPHDDDNHDHRLQRELLECPPTFLPSSSIEPPNVQTVKTILPSFHFPSFNLPSFNITSFELGNPVKLIVPLSWSSAAPCDTHLQESIFVGKFKQRNKTPCFKLQLRLARKQALLSLGNIARNDMKKLLAAVRNEDTEAVINLLDEGVSPNNADCKMRTPLHFACAQGAVSIVSILLEHQADPNKQDMLGNTPLHLVEGTKKKLGKGYELIAKLYMLHIMSSLFAACRADLKVVKLLISHGANIHCKDSIGRTPLCIVKSRLSTLRKDKSISTDKLIQECQMINDILHAHAIRFPSSEVSVDELCGMMESVSTREQVDNIADMMINKMSDLCLHRQDKVSKACTQPKTFLSIL